MLSQVKALLYDREVTLVKHIDSDITIGFGENRLWVATPWRLEKEGVIVIGSGNLVDRLSHEDYRDDYDECLKVIASYVSGKSVEVEFTDFNELIIQFSSGYTFHSFQDYGDDAENFQLYVHDHRYLVYPDHVEKERDLWFGFNKQ